MPNGWSIPSVTAAESRIALPGKATIQFDIIAHNKGSGVVTYTLAADASVEFGHQTKTHQVAIAIVPGTNEYRHELELRRQPGRPSEPGLLVIDVSIQPLGADGSPYALARKRSVTVMVK